MAIAKRDILALLDNGSSRNRAVAMPDRSQSRAYDGKEAYGK